MIELAIIEDNEKYRNALKDFFAQSKYFHCIFAVGSMEKFLKYYSTNISVKILLLDIKLPGISGIEGLRKVRNKLPTANIIMLTSLGDYQSIFQSICMGANGYLTKDISLPRLERELLLMVKLLQLTTIFLSIDWQPYCGIQEEKRKLNVYLMSIFKNVWQIWMKLLAVKPTT